MAVHDIVPLLTMPSGTTINLRCVTTVSPLHPEEPEGIVYYVKMDGGAEFDIMESELSRDTFVDAWATALNGTHR